MAQKTDNSETSNSLAAGNLVCRPKKRGGLGILDIKIQNTGLLLKFLHSFYNKKNVTWVSLIWSSYYEEAVPHASDPCGLFWWRDIAQLSDIYRGTLEQPLVMAKQFCFGKTYGKMIS